MPVDDSDELTLGDDRAGATAFSGAARVALVLVVCLNVAARVWRLADSCLWFDEIFGVHAARHSWGGMFGFVAADLIHPPLFYALLKLWTAAGGESLAWLRLLPVLLSVASVAPMLLLCRELRLGAWETNLALALAAVNGYLIKYAQEVRMYSLLLLLTLCSLWLLARFFNAADERRSRRTLAALALANLLLVYTHYYGWLVVASEAALLLLLRRGRGRARLIPFLLTVALAAVAYLPWVYALARQGGEQGRALAQNIGWVERPAAADVLQFLALMHEPIYFRRSSADPVYTALTAPAGLLLFGVPILLLLWRTARRARAGDGAGRGALCWLLVFSFLPLLLAFALSWVLPHSVWGTRHLIVVAAPYLVMAAAAVARLRPEWARSAVLVVLGCWVFWGALAALVRREAAPVWCAWEGHAARMMRAETAAAAGVVSVYAFEDLVAYHLWFALDGAGDGRFRVAVVKGVPGLAEDPAYFLPRAFDGVGAGDASALEGERIWVAFRAAAWDETRAPLKTVLERGYRVEEVYETGAQGQRAFMVSFAKGR